MENYSLSDLRAVTDNDGAFGGGSMLILIILFLAIFGGGGWGMNRGDYGTYATASSQQDILFGQKFSDLDNKIDRLGNGIADATFALNNSIKDGNYATQTAIKDCCCTTQRNVDSVRYDMANFANAINSNIDNKFAALEKNQLQQTIQAQSQQIAQLQLAQQMCGVVRYPNASTYYAGNNPFCGYNGGCGGVGNL